MTAEDGADVRHEYIDGELYAMTGASRRHGLLTLNIAAHLRPLLRGTTCQLFANDMKVRLQIAGQDIFYDPDLLLSCDPEDRETYYCTRPCLLVDQNARSVEVRRRERGWRQEVVTEGGIRLACLDAELPFDLVSEDVLAT